MSEKKPVTPVRKPSTPAKKPAVNIPLRKQEPGKGNPRPPKKP